eukprot:5161122-Prorocentrum_lima.AAC.1
MSGGAPARGRREPPSASSEQMKWTESLGRPCWRSRGAHSPGGRVLPKRSSWEALVNAEETSTNSIPQEWER